MTKSELIALATSVGWKHRLDVDDLYKGSFRIDFRDTEVELHDSYLNRFYRQQITDLQSVSKNKPWVIGPLEDGWFSLKANRWVK